MKTTVKELRHLDNYPGYYVTDDGRVFSARRTIDGFRERKLRSFKGYPALLLRGKSGKDAHRRVHALVAEAFIGPRPRNMQVLHYDGNKKNNHWTNLRYGTQKENSADGMRLGEVKHGDAHATSKLSSKDVRRILRLRRNGKTQAEVASAYGIVQSCVSMIEHGINWAHISRPHVSPGN